MVEKADFEWRIQAEREMATNERQRKLEQNHDLQHSLKIQMEIRKQKNEQQDAIKKVVVPTSGGPHLTDQE